MASRASNSPACSSEHIPAKPSHPIGIGHWALGEEGSQAGVQVVTEEWSGRRGEASTLYWPSPTGRTGELGGFGQPAACIRHRQGQSNASSANEKGRDDLFQGIEFSADLQASQTKLDQGKRHTIEKLVTSYSN